MNPLTSVLLSLSTMVPQEAPAPSPVAGPFVGSLPSDPPPAAVEPATQDSDDKVEPAPATPAAEGSKPAVPPIAPAAAEESPAPREPAPRATTEPSRPTTPSGPATADPNVGEILGRRFVEVSSVEAMENEVDQLRKTLDALVGEGSRSAEILNHLDDDETDLEGLGISPERADQIRGLSNDVRALRAKVQLMNMEGHSSGSPDEELRDVKELLADSAVKVAAITSPSDPGASERGAMADPDTAAGAGRRSIFPEREAILAFRAGDDAAVIEILSGLDRARMAADVLYAYGCALVNRRDLAEARLVLAQLEDHPERALLQFAAARQIRRIDHLENGIVSLHPLLKEGRDQ